MTSLSFPRDLMISANKGIFVTSKDFSSGARTIAQAKGIALVIARQGRWKVVMRANAAAPEWRFDYCYSTFSTVW